MQTQTISATALERLKRLAKQRRDSTGQSLNQSFEAIAQESGYATKAGIYPSNITLAQDHLFGRRMFPARD